MRLLVLDDHLLVAQAVGGLISELCNLELVALCATPDEAIQAITTTEVDLLVTDLDLAGEQPFEVMAALLQRNPSAKVVVLSGFTAERRIPPELQAACLAFIDKANAWSELQAVLQDWLQDQSASAPLDPSLQQRDWECLAPREKRLLLELGRGRVNKELAQVLGLSISSVETYRKTIASKLGVSGPELVRLAVLLRCTAACWFDPSSQEQG